MKKVREFRGKVIDIMEATVREGGGDLEALRLGGESYARGIWGPVN